MSHLGVFPYSVNESGQSYIFSALDCTQTREDFEHAEQDGTIGANYHAELLLNLYTSAQDAPNAAYWKDVG